MPKRHGTPPQNRTIDYISGNAQDHMLLPLLPLKGRYLLKEYKTSEGVHYQGVKKIRKKKRGKKKREIENKQVQTYTRERPQVHKLSVLTCSEGGVPINDITQS